VYDLQTPTISNPHVCVSLTIPLPHAKIIKHLQRGIGLPAHYIEKCNASSHWGPGGMNRDGREMKKLWEEREVEMRKMAHL